MELVNKNRLLDEIWESSEHDVELFEKIEQCVEAAELTNEIAAKREQCLKEAMNVVCMDRELQYGTPEDNFQKIADLWSAYRNEEFSSLDVAMMMALMKIARIVGGTFKEDNFIDLAGYAACGMEVASEKNKA